MPSPFMFVPLLAVLATAESPCSADGVKLMLKLPATVAPLQPVDVHATIRNSAGTAIVLVRPGDGSETRRRTPTYRWEVLDSPKGSDPRTFLPGPICGNINSLRPGEVFSLEPGDETVLGNWIRLGAFQIPGEYRLKLVFENDPRLEWTGLPLGVHDPAELERVRKSTPCRLESNEVVLVVK